MSGRVRKTLGFVMRGWGGATETIGAATRRQSEARRAAVAPKKNGCEGDGSGERPGR